MDTKVVGSAHKPIDLNFDTQPSPWLIFREYTPAAVGAPVTYDTIAVPQRCRFLYRTIYAQWGFTTGLAVLVQSAPRIEIIERSANRPRQNLPLPLRANTSPVNAPPDFPAVTDLATVVVTRAELPASAPLSRLQFNHWNTAHDHINLRITYADGAAIPDLLWLLVVGYLIREGV